MSEPKIVEDQFYKLYPVLYKLSLESPEIEKELHNLRCEIRAEVYEECASGIAINKAKHPTRDLMETINDYFNEADRIRNCKK